MIRVLLPQVLHQSPHRDSQMNKNWTWLRISFISSWHLTLMAIDVVLLVKKMAYDDLRKFQWNVNVFFYCVIQKKWIAKLLISWDLLLLQVQTHQLFQRRVLLACVIIQHSRTGGDSLLMVAMLRLRIRIMVIVIVVWVCHTSVQS